MRRTQLYLDDELWSALHVHARKEKTTVSELVRRAARDRYLNTHEERSRAMKAIIGIWQHRDDIGDSEEYVRKLRRGSRLERIQGK